MNYKRTLKHICAMILVPAITVGLYLGYLQTQDNFHEVIPGELYRSGQPESDDIASYVQTYGIKTILNLRGENIGEDWYDTEISAAKAHQIHHIDYMMLSSQQLTTVQALELIDIMNNAPKPILIHCQAGANRTSLAAALYMAAIEQKGEFVSQLQLSPLYGHIPVWFNEAYAMDRTFNAMEAVLKL